LLAALVVLAAVFAVVGARSAPNPSSLAVQNATAATFGAPLGTTSFSLHLSDSLSSGPGRPTISQTRLIAYTPPARMAVYQVGSPTRLVAVLPEQAIECALITYTANVSGSVPWQSTGDSSYTRTESLAEYSSRVPYATSTTCVPQPTQVHGTVKETATLKAGYLTKLTLLVVVPQQTLPSGGSSFHGVEGETLTLLKINGTPVGQLGG
jgi:hypothetical protein